MKLMKMWNRKHSENGIFQSKFLVSVASYAVFALLLCLAETSLAQNSYYQHVIFDNSITPDGYYDSGGGVGKPSELELANGHLPVESRIFKTPPNALRIKWQSNPGGVWGAEVRLLSFRNRMPGMSGTHLYLWCYAPEAIAAADLPKLMLSNRAEGLQVAEYPGSFTEPLSLGKYAGDLPAGKWVEVRIPLSDFKTASIYPFHPVELRTVIFQQGDADGVRHKIGRAHV